MAGFVLIGALAAFGLVCALWALAGWLLPGGRGGGAVCLCKPGLKNLAAVRRFCLLRELGLFRGPIWLVDCGLPDEEVQELSRLGRGTELCTMEVLKERLEQEYTRFERAGNGDRPGHDQCRGVSEL